VDPYGNLGDVSTLISQQKEDCSRVAVH